MPQGRSYYTPGASHTEVSFDGAVDPTAALAALIQRETTAPRPVAPQAQPMAMTMPQPGPMAANRRASRTTENVRRSAGDGARALMGSGAPEGRHSFVTNIKGGPGVMGGFIPTSSGASPGNTFYGGWQVDEAPGEDAARAAEAKKAEPVRFANLPSENMAAFAPSEDPAERAARLNTLANSGSRARFMPMAGRG